MIYLVRKELKGFENMAFFTTEENREIAVDVFRNVGMLSVLL